MTRFLPVVIGLIVGAVCARLGVWQLSRLDERQAFNQQRLTRGALPPSALPTEVPADPAELSFQRIRASGQFEFAAEVLEVARSYRGAPGVFVLTPLRLDDGSAVLVNRGWAYAADGRAVDLATLREPESTTVSGVLLSPRRDPRGIRPAELEGGETFFPLILRRTDPPDSLPPGLTVLDVPSLENGPHLSYAVQWFAFGVIAVVGGGILAWRSGEDGRRR